MLESLEGNRAFITQAKVNGGKEAIFKRLADTVGLSVEYIVKLDWIRRDGHRDLVWDVMSGMDLDEALDILFRAA